MLRNQSPVPGSTEAQLRPLFQNLINMTSGMRNAAGQAAQAARSGSSGQAVHRPRLPDCGSDLGPVPGRRRLLAGIYALRIDPFRTVAAFRSVLVPG